MANSTAVETQSFNTSPDDFNDIEFSNIDYSLLISLLDDSPVQGVDEDLRTVIQSLEAEIGTDDTFSNTNSDGFTEDYQSSDAEQLESCATSPDNLDFQFTDMEMAFDYHSECDNTDYFNFTDNMENMIEFVQERDYSHLYCEMPMEEAEYVSLWQ